MTLLLKIRETNFKISKNMMNLRVVPLSLELSVSGIHQDQRFDQVSKLVKQQVSE